MKKTVCVDFDGVLHSYVSGWKGVAEIPDPPVPGALDWLRELMGREDYEIAIYSSRSEEYSGIQAMVQWLRLHGMTFEEVEQITFPRKKPPAFLTIDDRCICFRGTFPSLQEMDSFQPWTKSWDGPTEEEEIQWSDLSITKFLDREGRRHVQIFSSNDGELIASAKMSDREYKARIVPIDSAKRLIDEVVSIAAQEGVREK